MTRRQVFALLVSLPLAAIAAFRSRTGYGHLTVQRAIDLGICPRVRVYLDGVHLTDRDKVMEADDVRGFVVRLRRDADGYYMPTADGLSIQRETLYGHVRIVVLPSETA